MKGMTQVMIAAVSLGMAGWAYGHAAEPEVAQNYAASQPADPTPAAPTDPNMSAPPAHTTSPGTTPGTGSFYGMAPNPNPDPNPRLAAIVPAGMSSTEACSGFNSINFCAATLHAAQNLKVPFTDLKTKVTSGARLNVAIHALRPDVDATAEEHRAEQQALSDLQAPRG
jgi:hypothetical protein